MKKLMIFVLFLAVVMMACNLTDDLDAVDKDLGVHVAPPATESTIEGKVTAIDRDYVTLDGSRTFQVPNVGSLSVGYWVRLTVRESVVVRVEIRPNPLP